MSRTLPTSSRLPGFDFGRLFWPACALVLLWRLSFCAQVMTNTSDLVRHLLYGDLVWRHGPSVAAEPLIALPYQFPLHHWIDLPYSYPVGALAFFTLLAGVWPTLLFAKLALTALEALNAWFVWRLTGRRWMALVYWAAPVSLFWVSHEGQFEPLQNLFVFAALFVLPRRPAAGGALLALAVQVKLTAVVALPWAIVDAIRRDRPLGRWVAGGFLLGLLPTLAAQPFYPAALQPLLFSRMLELNPYFWDAFDPEMFTWNPPWLIALHALASCAVLFILIAGMLRSTDRWAYVAPLLFVLFAKTATQFQFWYWIVWPPLLLPIPEPRIRRWLWFLYPLLDISAWISLFMQYGYPGHDFSDAIGVLTRIGPLGPSG